MAILLISKPCSSFFYLLSLFKISLFLLFWLDVVLFVLQQYTIEKITWVCLEVSPIGILQRVVD